jgi:hypothetical protein
MTLFVYIFINNVIQIYPYLHSQAHKPKNWMKNDSIIAAVLKNINQNILKYLRNSIRLTFSISDTSIAVYIWYWTWHLEFVSLRGYLHLKAKGRSPKNWSIMIGRKKWYLVFGYTPRNKWAWALVFFHGWKVYVESKMAYTNSDFLARRVNICCYLFEVAILEN